MKRAAVIAGVNHYDRDPSFRPLLYSDADCTELHGLLKHQARYDAVQLLWERCNKEAAAFKYVRETTGMSLIEANTVIFGMQV